MNLQRSSALPLDQHLSQNSAPSSRRLLALVTIVAVLLGFGVVSASPASATVGVDWNVQTPAESNWWNSVTYGNGVFVAVASGGAHQVMTSTDGATWTAQTAQSGTWEAVTFGNGLFVAVAPDGSNRVMTSPDGVTWTARSVDQNGWADVTYGNGLFVAVAYYGSSRVMTSPDGVTWTARSVEQNGFSGVAFGNGLFVAVATGGTHQVMTSPDGVTWTGRSATEANVWTGVGFGNGLFVAVAMTGANRVMTSPDGVTWSARSVDQSFWLNVTYGNGLFVAVAMLGDNRVMTSPDGVTWTSRSVPATMWSSVAYARGLFVVVGGFTAPGTNRVLNSGSLQPATVPAAPTSLVATPGNGSASIAFTAGDNGGAAITKYQVKVGSGAWTDAVGTTSPIAVSGLTNFAVSRIKVRAVNSVGDGAASTAVAVTPRPAGPSIVSATPSGSTGFVVAFSLNPLPGTTVSYQSVTAYARGTNTAVGTCRTYAKRTTCYLGGLTRGTDYDLRATAYLPVLGLTWHRATLEGSTLQVRTNR
jgi:hypothetical protein